MNVYIVRVYACYKLHISVIVAKSKEDAIFITTEYIHREFKPGLDEYKQLPVKPNINEEAVLYHVEYNC